MMKPYKRCRRSDPLGKRIIMYEGKIVKHIHYNEISSIGKALCSCGHIVSVCAWLNHTTRPICVNYHEVVHELPRYEVIV